MPTDSCTVQADDRPAPTSVHTWPPWPPDLPYTVRTDLLYTVPYTKDTVNPCVNPYNTVQPCRTPTPGALNCTVWCTDEPYVNPYVIGVPTSRHRSVHQALAA